MQGAWAPVQELLNKFGNGGARGPVFGQFLNLLRRWDFACYEKPEETLG